MQSTAIYSSPLGQILLAADNIGVTGLWFEGQKYFPQHLPDPQQAAEVPFLLQAKNFLDQYFTGQRPDTIPPLHLIGTSFQQAVWQILRTVPYGQTVSYGQLASQLAAQQGRASLPAQAVGSAIGRNPISILVPCHRVVGANGSLTGYAGGIPRKIELLKLEHAMRSEFFVPKHSTAP